MSDTIEKVSIIISKGSLDGIYPGLIMANGARAEGIEANLFFTFFGLDAIHKARHEHIKMATVGNPGLHFATMLGGLPGVSTVMTHYMNHKMEKLDIPSIPEFIEMIADTGAGLYACKASVDLFGLEKNDFIPQVQDIITVGEFYEKAAGGQIIFTWGSGVFRGGRRWGGCRAWLFLRFFKFFFGWGLADRIVPAWQHVETGARDSRKRPCLQLRRG